MTNLFIPQKRHLGWLMAVVGILLVGWLLFVYNIDDESMWYDEWISWTFATSSDLSSLMARYPFGTTPSTRMVFMGLYLGSLGAKRSSAGYASSAALPMLLAIAVLESVGYWL